MSFAYSLRILIVLVLLSLAAAHVHHLWVLLLGIVALLAIVMDDSQRHPF